MLNTQKTTAQELTKRAVKGIYRGSDQQRLEVVVNVKQVENGYFSNIRGGQPSCLTGWVLKQGCLCGGRTD